MSGLVGTIGRARREGRYYEQRPHDEPEFDPSQPAGSSGGGDSSYDGPGSSGKGSDAPLHHHHDGDVDNTAPSPARAYLLDWQTEQCEKRDLMPEDLHAAIHPASSLTRSRWLVVLHGLPADYARALLADSLDIDPGFLDAHVRRRHYRPRRGRYNGRARWVLWEYPELVEGFDFTTARRLARHNGLLDDLMSNPPVRPLTGDRNGGPAVVFCRASMWVDADCTPVLFLDRPVWKDPALRLSKACLGTSVGARCSAICYRDRTAGSGIADEPDDKRAGDNEIPSLEDTLWENLKDLWDTGTRGREDSDMLEFAKSSMLSEVVFDQWLGLFEVLGPPTADRGAEEAMIACYWQMLRCLEMNEDTKAGLQYRKHNELAGPIDWAGLLSRVHQRVALSMAQASSKKPTLTPASTTITTATTTSTRTPDGSRKTTTRTGGTIKTNNTSGAIMPPRRRTGRELMDENHRALDRISYLGGILIPLPIVSGILSMGDTFGPGGSQFFIFWAVSLPLSVLAVLIIYADTIRKAEVWVEVTTEHVTAASTDILAEASGEEIGSEKKGVLWRMMHRKAGKQDEEAPMEPPAVAVPVQPGVGRRIETAVMDEESDYGEPEQEPEPESQPAMPMLFTLAPGLLSVEPDVEPPEVILQAPAGGGKARAFKRQKLGWLGAARAIVYHKPRYCGLDDPDGVAAFERHQRHAKRTD